VKTDRRDAERLARCYRGGDLTAVWVPDAAHEALRDLVRAREAALCDQLRARHRLSKFLLRHGRRPSEGVRPWTDRYPGWVQGEVHFEQPAQEATLIDYLHEVAHAAARIERLEQAIDRAVHSVPPPMRAIIEGLQALRGVAQISAVTIVAELGQISRFRHPRQLMAYSGAVSQEHSSGERIRRGSISKTGNAHLRRIVAEAAWNYRHRPSIGKALAARQRGQCEGAASPLPSLRQTHGVRQTQAEGGHCHRAGALGLYLGDRRADRAIAQGDAQIRRLKRTDHSKSFYASANRQPLGRHTARRMLARTMRQAHTPDPRF
jgi:transposase